MFYGGQVRRETTLYVEEPCKSALQRVHGMPFDWSLNPYVGCAHRCTFCYVRAFERRADRPSDDRYGRTVKVKTNVVGVLRGELSRRSWQREPVCLGTATDPYQPCEGRYRLTRGCLEALSEHRTPVSITTRGPLVIRDIDVLVTMSRRVDVGICVSLPSVDEDVVRRTEPGTAPPHQRLRAVTRLVTAGIRAGILMAPILPGISDSEASISAVVRAARAAGATFVGAAMLNLRPGTREHFIAALEQDWPELVGLYSRLFERGAYLPSAVSTPALERVAVQRRIAGIADRRTEQPSPPLQPLQLALRV